MINLLKPKKYTFESEESLFKFLHEAEHTDETFKSITKISDKYSVSVIRSTYSYGGERCLFEIALVENGEVVYHDDFFNGDVGGYLTADDIEGACELVKTLN